MSTDTHNGVPAYYPEGDVFFDLFQRGNLDYEEGNTESLWVDQNDIRYHEEYNKQNACLQFPQAFGPVFRNVYWRTELTEEGAGAGPWTGGGIGNDAFNLNGNISAYVGGRAQGRIEPTYFAKYTIWENCGNDIRNSATNIRRDFKVMDPVLDSYRFTGTFNNRQLSQILDYLRISSRIDYSIKRMEMDDSLSEQRELVVLRRIK